MKPIPLIRNEEEYDVMKLYISPKCKDDLLQDKRFGYVDAPCPWTDYYSGTLLQ